MIELKSLYGLLWTVDVDGVEVPKFVEGMFSMFAMFFFW